MSFTQDELQSFHTILDQRLQAHLRDVEQVFDQRMSEYRRYNEHRLYAMQHELIRMLTFKLSEFHDRIERLVQEQLAVWQQSLVAHDEQHGTVRLNGYQQADAIEVQTELSWEGLVDVVGQALDERLIPFKEETRSLLSQRKSQDSAPDIQEIVRGIEHLERVIESLQVVMTANHALLSDRIYSHQQQPIEHAHPTANLPASTPVETNH
jgi:hypothetical protein